MVVADAEGRTAEGWGETPLSVQWVWPDQLTYEMRHEALKNFRIKLTDAWANFDHFGHPIEVGHAFTKQVLPALLDEYQCPTLCRSAMPWLAALVWCSALISLFMMPTACCITGQSVRPYGPEFMNDDLAAFLEPAPNADVSFTGLYPRDFLIRPRPDRL